MLRSLSPYKLLSPFRRLHFTDTRRAQLEASIVESGGTIETPPPSPISWEHNYVQSLEQSLRHKLRCVDFVVEVRDARIPVSTIHPMLRAWVGKKPRIIVFNKADLISHRDRVAWDRHFSEKDMQILWTSAVQKNGGISNLVRSFFDANFEVNRRRRRTNLVLRKNRMVLACMVGFPNVGKRALLDRLFGPHPKKASPSDIPDRGKPNKENNAFEWYHVEGGAYFMNEVLDVPPLVTNPLACLRLAICGNYSREATISETLIAESFISHLGAVRSGGQVMDRIYEDVGIHPRSLPPSDFIREVAEVRFHGESDDAGRHLLESFRRLDYGATALEMPYMVKSGFDLEEPLIYDKDTATGLQSGVFTRF